MWLTQPLLISLLAQWAGPAQGESVGLRTTANRVAVLATPVLMGGVAQLVGIENSFYVLGGFLIIVVLVVEARFRETFVTPRNHDP